jgi:ABC-2 type transport system ATP-binding protein
MRQRLGLAQALLDRPRVLLLDEPVSALDPAGRHDILALIEGLKGSTTVLMSTHILGDVERICDMIGIIDRGRLVAFGEREGLLKKYAVPVVEVVFDADEDAILTWAAAARNFEFVRDVKMQGNVLRIALDGRDGSLLELQEFALGSNLVLDAYRQVRPQLEDVFLTLVRG